MAASAATPLSPRSLWPASSPAQTALREDVEETLKSLAQNKRVRVSEFFKDFDPLRSGFITRTQFHRCMDQHLGIPLSDEAYEFLAEKYDTKSNGMFNYRLFVEALESAFDPGLLDGKPLEQIKRYQQVPPTLTSVTLSQEAKQRTDQLLQNCAAHYKTQGISVRSYYQDFDRNCMGYVTHSQFHRSFPGPSEVSESDIDLLASRYYDPGNGLCNYMKFNADIKSIWEGGRKTVTFVPTAPAPPKQDVGSLESILQKVRDVVYKNGIRTTEFFEDHDKLRSGIITENQFVCGLCLSVGKQAQLTREEIGKIAQHYRTGDGRIRYREFCNMMENAYNEPGLEKNPTLSVLRPLRGHLHRPLVRLANEEQEQMLEDVLERLRGEVKKRRLLLYTFFQDYDQHKGFTRGVTKSQFERLLSFLSLQVTPYELKLIMQKFEDPTNSGDVSYPAFVQAIDETFTGQVVEQETPPQEQLSNAQWTFPPDIPGDIEQLLAEIKAHVLRHQIRVTEWFEDFDPLRSGKIPVDRFRQGLCSLGLPLLSTSQFAVLSQRYLHPTLPDQILWREFVREIDSVFQQFPEDPAGCSGQPALPAVASPCPASIGEQHKQVLDPALQRLSQRISQKRVSVKPCFQDFDRHNRGYVTNTQFRRCLACLDLPASAEELALLELSFSSAKGFNYLQFLACLQPASTSTNMYQQRLAALEAQKDHLERLRLEQFDSIGPSLAEQVMNKIKIKVSRERIRVLEFMQDYDKLRSGWIPLTLFHRVLDVCGFSLSPFEVAALGQRYRSFKDPQGVDYVQFSDDVESIFTTKDLEKMPTTEVEPFVPPHDIDLNWLSPQEEETLETCMHRFAERVRTRRVQLYPLFEDYDGVHIGSITRSQFRRVLSGVELAGVFSDLDFDIVYRKFGVKMGGRNDVNYIAFCGMVEQYAENKWTDPALH